MHLLRACLPAYLVLELCQLSVQLRQQLEQVTHQPVVCNLEDGSIPIGVDGHNDLQPGGAGSRADRQAWGRDGRGGRVQGGTVLKELGRLYVQCHRQRVLAFQNNIWASGSQRA